MSIYHGIYLVAIEHITVSDAAVQKADAHISG